MVVIRVFVQSKLRLRGGGLRSPLRATHDDIGTSTRVPEPRHHHVTHRKLRFEQFVKVLSKVFEIARNIVVADQSSKFKRRL
jgi:hypothetical protein